MNILDLQRSIIISITSHILKKPSIRIVLHTLMWCNLVNLHTKVYISKKKKYYTQFISYTY